MKLPRIVYNAVTLLPAHPLGLWEYANVTHGGSLVLDNLQSETFVRGTWRLLEVAVRFPESQWTEVDAWIQWCHANGGGPFTARLDVNDAATEATYYLHEPAVGDRWKPERDFGYPKALRLNTVWRRNSATALYFPVDG